MRVSLRWLRELLPQLPKDADAVAKLLTDIGLAVDGIEDYSRRFDGCVIAEVARFEPHPSRSNLRLVTVRRGNGPSAASSASNGEQTVVCGAPNVPEPGHLVVLAGIGANLPGVGFALERRAIGGVPSEGMLCSESELGVSEASAGIIVMAPGSFAVGTPLIEAYPELDDAIFELDITPNRPDALGHVGVARDLAARLALPFALPEPPKVQDAQRVTAPRIAELVTIENRCPERCPRYGAAAVVDVTIGPGPTWMAWRLQRLGIRPISNVVDITNWLLLLFGHPTHAFDLDRVRGSKIIVRMAQPNEPFTTLDGVERCLDADDLVIADGEAPSALGGVMGGADSEIRNETKRILLECAYFVPTGIRRTAKRHAMHTESSHRFERGVDWGAVAHVLNYGQALLATLAGGKLVDELRIVGDAPIALPQMRLRSTRLDALLGIPVPFAEVRAIFERLGFGVAAAGATAPAPEQELAVTGASHRPDVTIEADLIEEVARIRGLDCIPTRLPRMLPQTPRKVGTLEREVVATAVNLGLSEALLYGFVAPSALEKLMAEPSPVVLENPLSEDRSVLRTSLLPGLLDAVGRSRRRGDPMVRLFSVGSVFLPPGSPRSAKAEKLRPRLSDDVAALPVEESRFAAVLAGPRPSYLKKPEDVDVYDAKGLAVELCERLLGQAVSVRHCPESPKARHLHPRGAAEVLLGSRVIGQFGPLHPDVVDAFDLGESLQVVELDLAAVEDIGRTIPRYSPIARLPAIVRDVSFELSDAIAAGDVVEQIRKAAGELCESVELFDLFTGGALPKDKRALAFRLVYRDPKARTQPDTARTLTDAEVDACQAAVVSAIQERFGSGLRGA
ncbi:MAG TPA: phenylalanine--tRNA ligase subunit beta [Polyangiaceae bacterium]